jgi:hypothetical protein
MTTGDQKSRHKPSEKVTLEEVLKSLQDMIHTDLLESEHVSLTQPGEEPDNTPNEETQPKGREAPAIEDFASPSPVSGPVNLGAVMRSLKDLVNNELNVGDEARSSGDAGSASRELRGPETETNPEVEVGPVGAEDSLLDSLASFPEDVSFPESDAIPEPTSTASEIEAMEFETAPEEIEAAPLPVDTSDTVQPKASEPDEVVFGAEMPEFDTEAEQIEAAPLPFDTSDTTAAPAGEIPATSGTEDESANTEQPAPKSKRPDKNAPPGGLQHELLLDEAPAHTEAPTVLESEGILAAVIDSDTEPASETPAPLESANTETVSTQPSTEPEAPPEFLEPDAVLEIPAIENPQAPSALDRAAMKMEIDAPAQEAQNTPAIDFDAITLDEPIEESAPVAPVAVTPTTESVPAPLAAGPAVDEMKIEAPVPQAMSMPSIDFNTASPEKPGEKSQPAAPSSNPLPLTSDSPMLSVEFSPSSATPAKSAQETPSVAENKTSAIESTGKPAAAPVEPPKQTKLDDIPVLQDVVNSPAGKIATKEPMTEMPSPSPDHTRDAVIRAVAKLNIELRKSGGSGLDPKLINRLQQYMREELEKTTKKEE